MRGSSLFPINEKDLSDIYKVFWETGQKRFRMPRNVLYCIYLLYSTPYYWIARIQIYSCNKLSHETKFVGKMYTYRIASSKIEIFSSISFRSTWPEVSPRRRCSARPLYSSYRWSPEIILPSTAKLYKESRDFNSRFLLQTIPIDDSWWKCQSRRHIDIDSKLPSYFRKKLEHCLIVITNILLNS
jgi:hypothetical protein